MYAFFKSWVIPIIISLFIVFILNAFVFILVIVPSGSMINTICPGDKLFVSKILNKNTITRGDVLVFTSDELSGKKLVKRVIGLPNDKIEFKTDGNIYVNGALLDEPYAIKSTMSEKIFTVPEDHYFFVGDNRPKSDDSRFWVNPYISKNKIIGKAIFVFFPFNRIGIIK